MCQELRAMCYTRSSAGLYVQNTIPTEITPEAVREGREGGENRSNLYHYVNNLGFPSQLCSPWV